VVAPAVGLIVDRLLFRRLDDASQASKIVVTLGLLTLLQGGVAATFGSKTQNVQPFLPQHAVKISSVYVGYDQMITVALSVAILGALLLFFRRSRLGLTMRAVVDNRQLTETSGFESSRITMFTWALGVVLAGLAGILFSPLLGLDTTTLTLLVVQCYAAAIFGRLVGLTRTFFAALALGIADSLALKVFSHFPALLNGLRPSLPFIFLFLVLVFAKRGSLRELGVSAPWSGTVRTYATQWWLVPALLVVVAFVLPTSRVFSLGFAVVLACAFLSITVLTGSSGLISLTQAGLAGTGAFTYIHLTHSAGMPFLLALVLAGLAAVPLGVAIAIPALRLPGLFLALATFGFGELIDGLLFNGWRWFSGSADGLRGSRPSMLHSDRDFVLFLIAVLALYLLAVSQLRRRALGRALVALRDSPAAAEALGINPLWPRLAIFALSAFMAGVAGGLYAGLLETASSAFFSVFTSLIWVTIVVVGGVESPFGALIGALLFGFFPTFFATSTGATITKWLTPGFGLGAILLARQPGGLAALLGWLSPRRLVRVRPAPAATGVPADA
jgi:branched-chain amino acid transport system permease protein